VKNIDWKDFLNRHHLFWTLKEKEINRLLEVSEEKDCPQGSVILREGEFGDSIFLIGSGSVQIVLQGEHRPPITLSILKKGEFFGETAPIAQRPRSATVIARENSTLLEIKGKEFLEIMEEHSEIASKVLLTLSERLRHTSEHVSVKLKDVDEKINLFNIKLDSELKAVEASLKAAQTVFDQTKMRTDEVINSAERRRTQLTFFITAISLVIAVLGSLGVKEILELRTVREEVIKGATFIRETVKHTKKQTEELEQLSQLIDDTRTGISQNLLMPAFVSALEKKNQYLARDIYQDLKKLNAYEDLIPRVLAEIEDNISEQIKKPELGFGDYTGLLGKILEDTDAPEEKIKSYLLLLSNAILNDVKIFPESGRTFNETVSEFENYVGDHEDQQIERTMLSMLEKRLEQEDREKQKAFARIKQVIQIR
jgi:CRP-like cAMP-binding protein